MNTQAFQGDWPSRYVTAQALKFISLMSVTGHSRIQGKAVPRNRPMVSGNEKTAEPTSKSPSHGLCPDNRISNLVFKSQALVPGGDRFLGVGVVVLILIMTAGFDPGGF